MVALVVFIALSKSVTLPPRSMKLSARAMLSSLENVPEEGGFVRMAKTVLLISRVASANGVSTDPSDATENGTPSGSALKAAVDLSTSF